MSPITPKVNNRLSTEQRVQLLIETLQDRGGGKPLPDIPTIALITGARSAALVKSVLYDMGISH